MSSIYQNPMTAIPAAEFGMPSGRPIAGVRFATTGDVSADFGRTCARARFVAKAEGPSVWSPPSS